MAGRGAAPGERRGGRTKGIPNKATVVKKLAVEALSSKEGKEAVVEAFAKATMTGNGVLKVRGKRAVEILDDIAKMFLGLAAQYQPRPDPVTKQETNQKADVDRFALYLGQAQRAAAALAPFQDPTFKAIAVQDVPPPPKENDGAQVIDSMAKRTQQDAGEVYARLVRGAR